MNETFQSLLDATRICAFGCSIPAGIAAALRRRCLFWATKQSGAKKRAVLPRRVAFSIPEFFSLSRPAIEGS
jgi:hypothetical protein